MQALKNYFYNHVIRTLFDNVGYMHVDVYFTVSDCLYTVNCYHTVPLCPFVIVCQYLLTLNCDEMI